MAKFNVTRHDALAAIITFARDNDYDNADVLAVLDNMLSKLVTTPKRSGETPTHKTNAAILAGNMGFFDDGNTVSAREFANMVPNFPLDNMGRPSVHKATAILVQGVNDGVLVKAPTEKKSAPMRYARA
jgi:hypothetical protein